MQSFLVALLIMGILFFSLFIYAISKQRNKNAVYFSLMCLSKAVFIFGYYFELNSKNLDQLIFFIKLQYMGLPFILFFWLLFLYKYNFNKYASFKTSLALLTIPVITVFFNVTNEYHKLFFKQIALTEVNGICLTNVTNGPFYYVFVFYCCACITLSFFIFLNIWRKHNFKLKNQAFWLFVGNVLVMFFLLIYFYNLSSSCIKIYVFCFICTTITFFIALFKYDLLELDDIVRSIIFSSIREGIIVTDKKGRLIDFNNTAKNMFNWVNSSNIGNEISSFDEGYLMSKSKTKDFGIELYKNGQKKYYDIYITPLKEKVGTFGKIYILQDVTNQKELMTKLSDMANIDPLTGIFNRRKFLEQTQHEISKAKKYKKNISTLMIDVDNFKIINDTYGHLAGDKVLKTVAQEIKKMLKDTDIICRYGGEEFAVILTETELENVYLTAENIRKSISNIIIKFNKHEINVTVSIGIYSKFDKDLTLYQLIEHADKALYRAKNSGRNIVVAE